MSRGEKIACAIGAVAALSLAAWYYYPHATAMPATSAAETTRDIIVGTTTVRVDVVSTEAAREQGLSGRSALAPDTGMLFVFDSDGKWGIWMKDMRFNIDIVWLSQDGTVITAASDVSPDTYPEAFYPTQPARYVVELPAGFAAAHAIAEGTKFSL